MNGMKTGGNKSAYEAVKPCAVCLFRVGFGIKIATRLTFIPHTTVKRLKKSLNLEGVQRRGTATFFLWKDKQIDPLPFLADVFQAEQRAVKRSDGYWGRHPAIINHYSSEKYHSLPQTDRLALNKRTWLRRQLDPFRSVKREQWRRAKRVSDPAFKLREGLSARLAQVMQGKKAGRSFRLFVGCNERFLKQHIERQFKRGMTWANHGTHWQVDHILPVAAFDHADDS